LDKEEPANNFSPVLAYGNHLIIQVNQ